MPLFPLAMVLLAQTSADCRLGENKVSYRVYAPASRVCEAEPKWLYDELDQVNGFLDAFLVHSTARNGTWGDQQLPLLEQASRCLPALVEAHEASLNALEGCDFSSSGLYPQLRARGVKLVKDARGEVARLPELIRFAKHRQGVERWERERAAKQDAARADCKKKNDPKFPQVYFAYEDELGTKTWLFCDDAKVRSVTDHPFEFWSGDGKSQDVRLGQAHIQAARVYPESARAKAPPAW